MMLLDVTGKLTGPRCRLRLRTNMHICWNQAFVAADCRLVSPGANTPGSPATGDARGGTFIGVMIRSDKQGRALFLHERSKPALLASERNALAVIDQFFTSAQDE